MLAQIWFHVPLFLPEGHMHTFSHRRAITILLSSSHICALIITTNFLTVQFNPRLTYLPPQKPRRRWGGVFTGKPHKIKQKSMCSKKMMTGIAHDGKISHNTTCITGRGVTHNFILQKTHKSTIEAMNDSWLSRWLCAPLRWCLLTFSCPGAHSSKQTVASIISIGRNQTGGPLENPWNVKDGNSKATVQCRAEGCLGCEVQYSNNTAAAVSAVW